MLSIFNQGRFKMLRLLSIMVFVFLILSCKNQEYNSGFTLLKKDQTGLTFRNILKEDENFNIFKYQYYYNGGGVALIDYNRDGLEDIFLTGNMVKNRLFENLGNLKFKDVTENTGLADLGGWCSGVNAVDINNDGWQDLYVCRAGYPFEEFRKNLLFINNRDGSFKEQAGLYGIDDSAHSTHSSFFDYDRDGDLDLFLLNHSTPEYSKGNLEVLQLKNKKDPSNTNKLYRNDNGKFTDVTQESGITGNVLSYSLGVITVDFNNDNYTDVFVANDFNEPDYLFINNGDGTFSDEAESWFSEMSKFSMGVDVSDLTDNSYPDLVTLDMLPESNYLQKMHSGADNYDKVEALSDEGFLDQYSRNVLQINTGSSFREIGQFAGISNTDWSWAPLFMDFDNDGQEDLFISNGYQKDHTDMDFLQFTANEVISMNQGNEAITFEEYISSMPPINQPNYFFERIGKYRFKNQAGNWGINLPSVSQGAAYGDLDNDGDLDLVVNNSGDYAWIYRNNNSTNGNNWIQVELKGAESNGKGIGSKIHVHSGDRIFHKTVQPSRGFQSSMSGIIHFGLGNLGKIDSIVVTWPDASLSILKDIQVNQKVVVPKENLITPSQEKIVQQKYFYKSATEIPYVLKREPFRDFNVQGLMPFYLTDHGPVVKVADINRDGLEDIIVGGNTSNPSGILYQNKDGSFSDLGILKTDIVASDMIIEDINDDQLLDIIISNGSYQYLQQSNKASIEIFINKEGGAFKNFSHSLASTNPSGLALTGKEKKILIVGGKEWYNQFPLSSETQAFEIKNTQLTSIFTFDPGIVHSVEAVDLDADREDEIILSGPWEAPGIYNLVNDKLTDITEKFIDVPLTGYWTSLFTINVNQDEYPDLLFGNLGLNNQLNASKKHPMLLHYGDMDGNGSIDPFVSYYVMDGTYPLASREDAIKQVPLLNKRYHTFDAYANADINELLNSHLDKFKVKHIDTLGHLLMVNENGKLVQKPLESTIQFAPLYALAAMDIDDDGDLDIVTGGNKLRNKVKIGKLSGNEGDVYLNEGNGNFKLLPTEFSGIYVKDDIRAINKISIKGDEHILFTPHSGKMILYKANKHYQ